MIDFSADAAVLAGEAGLAWEDGELGSRGLLRCQRIRVSSVPAVPGPLPSLPSLPVLQLHPHASTFGGTSSLPCHRLSNLSGSVSSRATALLRVKPGLCCQGTNCVTAVVEHKTHADIQRRISVVSKGNLTSFSRFKGGRLFFEVD